MGGSGASSGVEKAVKDQNGRPESASNSVKPSSKQKERRNVMLKKFRAGVEPSLPPYSYMLKLLFFCCSLTDPLRIQEVLRLLAPPVLKHASVQGYKIMLWGQYHALVDY